MNRGLNQTVFKIKTMNLREKINHYKQQMQLFCYRQTIKQIIFSLICLIFFCDPVYANPFKVPEKFIFDLNWIGIKAGTASLELKNDGDKIKIISTAQSAKWISIFYTVNDRAESTLLQNSSLSIIGQPVNYKLNIQEGRHRRNKEVIFDYAMNKALYIDHLKNEKKEIDLPDFVHDPLSSFYHLRTLELVVGTPVYITIFDSKKVWNTEIQILRKEKVTVPAGTFDTIVVKPLMKSEGIFHRKGDIFIWLTDDTKHIPVKMEIKVAIGSITANLVEGIY